MSDDSAPQVSVLVVGFQSRDEIGACLASVRDEAGDVRLETLFVDQSGDGSEDVVAREHPEVTIVPSQGNRGFGGGVNLLAARARGRHLVLLNPDALVRERAVERLVRFVDGRERCGVAGGLVRLPGGGIDGGCLQDPPTLRHQLQAFLGRPRYKRAARLLHGREVLPVPTPSGAFLCVRRADFEAVGGMDESFFLYSEEVDLCRRIASRGREVLLYTGAWVEHGRGSSQGGLGPRQLAMWRGKMHFEHKHYGGWHEVLMGGLLWLHGATRLAAGLALAPVRPSRARALRRRFAAIALRPRSWLGGWGPLSGNGVPR